MVRLRKNNKIIDMYGYLEEDYGIDCGYRYTPSFGKRNRIWGF